MEIFNLLFSLNRIIQVGAIVLSFLFIVLTIQSYANIILATKTLSTKRNTAIVMVSALLIIVSVLLFILGFVIL